MRREFFRVMNPNALKYSADEENRERNKARIRQFQPAAGRGRSDRVRKSQRLDTGEYVPASQLSSADRQKMTSEMRRRKDPYYTLPWQRNSSYERKRRAKLRAEGVTKAFQVYERQVHPLENRFEQQRRLVRAAAEGGLSLSSGDYEYLPFAVGEAGVRRKQPVVRRAYAQRENPRFFDRVAHAQTSDPNAALQVRHTNKWQRAGERVANSLGAGAAGAAAGLLLGARRHQSLKAMAMAARAGNYKALNPGRSAWKSAGGFGAASAGLGAVARPAPVQLRYQSDRRSS